MKWASLLRPLEILQVWYIGVFACIVVGATPSPEAGLYLLTLLLHISGTYFLNDYFDWESDRANPRRRTFIKRPFILLISGSGAMLLSSGLAFKMSVEVGTIFIGLNFLGLAYSVPPLRLKARRPFPILVHAICGAFYFGTALLALKIVPQATDSLYAIFWAVVLASGSLFNEVLDARADQESGIQTLGQNIEFSRAKLILTIVHGCALVVFILAQMVEGFYFSLGAGILFFGLYLKLVFSTASATPEQYRKVYRWIFALLTLVPCAESLLSQFFL